MSVRAEFPALVSAPEVVYLDSASTTQKPQQVVDTVSRCLSARTANPGRGGYPWSTALSAEILRVREQVACFLGAVEPGEIVFTSGATAAMQTVALDWGLNHLSDGDEILYCPDDHDSTVTPWIRLRDQLRRFGVRITLVEYQCTETGSVDVDAVAAAVGKRTRLIVISQVHSIYGAENPIARLASRLDPRVLLGIDCSQSMGHLPVDVRALRADFALFSGHKMFASPGVGVLYRKRGTAVESRNESGSPDAPAILGLGSAIDFVERIGVEPMAAHNIALTARATQRLAEVPGIQLLRADPNGRSSGIVSLRIPGVTPTDIGFILAAGGVYARTGGHCMSGADSDATRLSTHIYNTEADIDRACELLEAIAKEAG